jgi:tetratricopeptide (TPR) repeat protein
MIEVPSPNDPTTMKIKKRLTRGTAASLLIALLSCGCSKTEKSKVNLNSAQQHAAKGNYAAAEIEFKNALTGKPGEPQALKGLGLTLLRQGATFEAGQLLSAAKQKLPEDDQVGVGLAQVMAELGYFADSRKEVLEVIARVPTNGEALLMLAEASLTPETMTECEKFLIEAKSTDSALVQLASALLDLRRGKLDVAAESIEKALKLDPKCARAHALQGNLFSVRKEPEKALDSLRTAADLAGPRSAETSSCAKLLMNLGHKEEAMARLKKATETAPDYLPNWRLLGQIAITAKNDSEAAGYLAKVLAKSPFDIAAGVLQSEIWLRQKEPAKALELMEKLTKTFPGRPQLELILGKTYLASGDRRKATEALDRTLVLAPQLTEAILLRAGLHLQAGQAEEAIPALEPLATAAPPNRMAQDLLVQAYCGGNRSDDAIALLKKQIHAAPEQPAPHLRLGQILVAQNKLVEARAAFESALKIAPNELACISPLIALDQQEGKVAEAMTRADDYLRAHPESPQANLLKAGLCFIQKDYKTAEALSLKTIDLNPQDLVAYGMLVRIQISDGRSEQAVTRLQDLLKTAPNNIPARMQLSILLQELGRIEEARASFLEMVKIAPEFAPAYNNLACLESKPEGNLDKALEYARKARTLAPQSPAIADTLGWVEWLRGSYDGALPLLLEAAAELPQSASVQYHLAMAHYMMNQSTEARAVLEKALAIPGGFPEKSEAERRLGILRDSAQADLATLEPQAKNDPKDVVLAVFLAQKLAAAERPQDAADAFQRALASNPNLEIAHLGLAALYSNELNQPEKAMESATLARKAAPQSSKAVAALGLANFRLGKHDEAYDLLQDAALKLPSDATVQEDFAWVAYSTGRIADARAIMGKLASTSPNRAAGVRDFLALTGPDPLSDSGVVALLEKKLSANPGDVPALMVRAELQKKAGECPADTYVKVLETFPQFDPARVALARIYLKDPEQLEAAEKLATAARARLKDDPDLTGMLAIISFRKGQFDYAAQLLAELSAKRPLTGDELLALGMSQVAVNRSAEALQTLTRALKSGLSETDAATARAALDKLTNPDAKE